MVFLRRVRSLVQSVLITILTGLFRFSVEEVDCVRELCQGLGFVCICWLVSFCLFS